MLPIGVTTFELTFGQTFDYEGVSLQTDLTIVPSHEVRTAAGERIVPALIETSSPVGEYGSIDLPQPGQGNLYDLKGNLITNWWYTVTAVDSKAGRTVGDMKVWKLQPTIDQMVVDLDTQPTDQVVGPVGSVAPPAVTSVNGGTGAVTVEGVTDAALTAIAADTGSDFYAQQSATIAAAAGTSPLAMDLIGLGATMPRTAIQSAAVSVGADLLLSYFTAHTSGSCSGPLLFNSSTAASGLTLSKFALFEVGVANALTRLAITANMGAAFAAHYRHAPDWLAPVSIVKGRRYALASLAVGGGGMSLRGMSISGTVVLASDDPYLARTVAAQSDIAASYVAGDLGFLSTSIPFAALRAA